MNAKWNWEGLVKKLRTLLDRYKYVLMVILVGVVLLLIPGTAGEKQPTQSGSSPPAAAGDQGFDLETMERKLESALSDIDGAGSVSVVLSVREGERSVVARDTTVGDREDSETTVVVSKGSGTEEPVVLQKVYPQYQGALVVCEGGGNAAVRLKLTEAVAALTGLGTDRISICKAK